MITDKQTLHNFVYRGSAVSITHCIFISDYPMSHFEIQSEPSIPLPMTETGYRSYFQPYYDQDYEGLKECCKHWAEECTNEIQPSLF